MKEPKIGVLVIIILFSLALSMEGCIEKSRDTESKDILTTTVTETITRTETIMTTSTKTINYTITKKVTTTYTITETKVVTKTITTTVTLTSTKSFVTCASPNIKYIKVDPSFTPLDKVDHITIEIYIEGDTNCKTYGRVEVIPKTYPLLNDDAFPNENKKQFLFNASGVHIFEAKILGGREYIIKVKACNKGGCTEKGIVTPYYRQYKNLAKILKERGIIISTVYMAHRSGYFFYEEHLIGKPLLGSYDSWGNELSNIVQWKHIDWANGHGISVFWIEVHEPENVPLVLSGFLEKGMSVGLMVSCWDEVLEKGSADLSDKNTKEKFVSLIKSLGKLLNDPNYYRINGRPAIFIWAEATFKNRREAYEEIFRYVKEVSGSEPYLITDIIPAIYEEGIDPGEGWKSWWNYRNSDGGESFISAYSGWIGFFGVAPIVGEGVKIVPIKNKSTFDKVFLSRYNKHLQEWREYVENSGRCFIPTVSPGFSRTWDPRFISYEIDRNVSRFKKMLELAIKYRGHCGEIRIDTWNDFVEATFVEPSESDKFLFLEAIKDVVEKYVIELH
ncbi:glycoside hydrolase family 99-like domain-containing protein [Pyrococcus yayanosii]|uniref:Uncharacterized protein n=1 Tax=Pyrococcus yayanosii (strain CH1 / JCM 16557) TaxID=529709 RepID=F8AFF0_PYRYC|nr:glycoside hydrolase family 99-like domain-containing protein [Pyrococcus yayanosii]AEH23757.1 hypothetical protein PYCH_00440 [Pyrococcus yayanosii CH1]